jgi:predicted transcriptional regulator
MSSAISVRLDSEALRALAQIESTGLSRSEAIRKAILDSAGMLRRRDALAVEMAALEADEDDRREMLEVADFMESMRAGDDIHEFRPARGTGHEQHRPYLLARG